MHLRKQNAQAQELLAPLYAGIQAVADERGLPVDVLMAVVGTNAARELMEIVNVPMEQIREIDRALHKISNQL